MASIKLKRLSESESENDIDQNTAERSSEEVRIEEIQPPISSEDESDGEIEDIAPTPLDRELSDEENAPTNLSAGQKFARSTLDGLSEKRKEKIVKMYIDTRAGLPEPQPDGHLVERLNWQAVSS